MHNTYYSKILKFAVTLPICAMFIAGCATEKHADVSQPAPAAVDKYAPQKPQPINDYEPGKVYQLDQRDALPTGAIIAANAPSADVEVPGKETIQVVAADTENMMEVTPIKNALERQLGSRMKFSAIPAKNSFTEYHKIIAESPHTIITIGPEILGITDQISTHYPETRFITIGGQLAEPTDNVNAVVWSGASSRAAIATEQMDFKNTAEWGEKAARLALKLKIEEPRGMVYFLG